MQLLIPFAAPLSDAGQAALGTLALPRLATLLARWQEVARDAAEETTLSPPHERALAAAWGWPVIDGLLPLAAAAAADDGLAVEPADPAWALLSPTHWQPTAEQVALTGPDDLALDESEARALFDALEPLFADAGWTLLWGAPTRWYARDPGLALLPTASLDRVAGRSIEPWLNRQPEARALHRLQAEAQMLLHRHPLNAEREAIGAPPVNSFWASGTGVPRPVDPDRRRAVRVDASLRAAALAEDWTAWADAWRRIDADSIARLLESADAAEPLLLTLCGERSAATWAPQRRPRWRRWLGAAQADVAAVLATL
jgi:hypothetical protein